MWLGDFDEDSTLHFIWSSNNASGASITRATDGTISVYKDNGTTQSTAGITDTEDFDSLTGIHALTIDLSSDAFYATGANYTIVLSGATIDGQTVNAVLGNFSIENRGLVAIAKAVWDRVLTGATHNIATSAGRRLRGIQEFQGYEGGAIWVDTVNGVAGTVDYENGTVENPVSTWADALTLNTSLGFDKFIIKGASAITLSANSDGYHIIGSGATTLALNGQSVIGVTIDSCVVSGVMAGVGTTQRFLNCAMGATTLIKGTHVHNSGITGTQTVGEAGDIYYALCHSGIAGTDTWTFDFGGAIGNTNLNLRHNSGGVQFENMGDSGTDTASLEGYGQLIEGTCTGGTVAVRGMFTTSGITNLTLVDDARFAIVHVAKAIWDRVISKANHNIAGSAGKLLRHLSDVTAVDGTVDDASATTTSFVTDLTEATDDYYNDALVIFINGSSLQGQARPILDYDGTTKTITVSEAFTSAPADTDEFIIKADHIHPVSQIASGVWDLLTAGHTTASTFGYQVKTIIDTILARLPSALVGGRMDSNVSAVDNNTASAITMAKAYEGITYASAITGTLSVTQMTTDLVEDTDDHFNGRIIVWTSGALKWQATQITDYDGATKMVTYTATTEAPSNGDTFVIY